MTDKQKLLALADRCEAAEGADRELDWLIAIALNEVPIHSVTTGAGMPYGWFRREGQWSLIKTKESDPRAGIDTWTPEPRTASLDAAITLVPEGFRYVITPGKVALLPDGQGPDFRSDAATDALALSAAALRARAAS